MRLIKRMAAKRIVILINHRNSDTFNYAAIFSGSAVLPELLCA